MTDCLLISFFTHFYLFLRVANIRCCAHQKSSKQKQFCVHVQQIIVNPGKLLEIPRQYHVISWLTYWNYNSVWCSLSCKIKFHTLISKVGQRIHFVCNIFKQKWYFIVQKLKYFFWIFSATGTSEEWQPTIKRWEWSVNTSHLKVVQIIIKKARKKKNLLFFPYKPEED